MPEFDYVMKKLLSDKTRFADLYNGAVFEGRQMIKPEELTLGQAEQGTVVVNMQGMRKTVVRRRDVIMKGQIGTDPLMLCCECQHEMHLAMPVRCMTYDGLDYTEQIRRMEKHHRERKELLKSDAFLSGMTAQDRLIPVISLVLYVSKKPWSGYRSLQEMIRRGKPEGEDKEWMKFLPDYHINLVDVCRIQHLDHYHTSLQQVFGMVKYSSDKDQLYEYIRKEMEHIRAMDEDSMMAALTLIGEQKRLMKRLMHQSGEERMDLCKAIDDLIADGEERGKEIGEDRMARLAAALCRDNRQELLLDVISSQALRTQLYEQYRI